jgi:PKD repeat protein
MPKIPFYIAILLLMTVAVLRAEIFSVDFIAEPASGEAPLIVAFRDRSTGEIDERLWDFDFDGLPDSNEKNPVVTYHEPGIYTVNLIVLGAEGALTKTKNDLIIVGQPSINKNSRLETDDPLPVIDTIDDGDGFDEQSSEFFTGDQKEFCVYASNSATAESLGAEYSARAAAKVEKDKTQKIKLRWDANSETNLVGYKIYYSANRQGPPYLGEEADQGPSPIIVYLDELQNEKEPKFELSGMSKNNEYYFAVTAFDNAIPPNESNFSNEASTLQLDNNSEEIDQAGGGGGGGCFIQSAVF